MKLTAAEVEHIRAALSVLDELISGYPEVVTQREEDKLAVAQEIMSEDSNT